MNTPDKFDPFIALSESFERLSRGIHRNIRIMEKLIVELEKNKEILQC